MAKHPKFDVSAHVSTKLRSTPRIGDDNVLDAPDRVKIYGKRPGGQTMSPTWFRYVRKSVEANPLIAPEEKLERE